MKPYYEDASVRLYLGKAEDVLDSLALGLARGEDVWKIDHLFSDPPYSKDTHKGARTHGSNKSQIDFESIAVETLRYVVSASGAARWVVMTCDWQHVLPLKLEPPVGFSFVRKGVWIKPNGAPQFTGDRPAQGHEDIAILHRSEEKLRWNGGGRHAVYTQPVHHVVHKTQKPEFGLAVQFVNDFSDVGETILDPFCGTGTTGAAAKRLGRRFVGIDINERWLAHSAQRLSQGTLDLFGED